MTDSTLPAGHVLFYPVTISNSASRARGTSLCWGPPFDRPSEAQRWGRTEVEAGRAVMAFVVRFGEGKKTAMPRFVWPPREEAAVRHWLELEEALSLPRQ
jgi:hypothetical protein